MSTVTTIRKGGDQEPEKDGLTKELGFAISSYHGSVDLDVTIRSRTIIAVLVWCIVVLTALSVAGQVAKHAFGYPYVFGLVNWLALDREANPPTYYQAVALLLASVLSAATALRERGLASGYWRHWIGIALIFVYLSADEAAQIHEATIPIFHRFIQLSQGMLMSGAWSPMWEFYALPMVALVAALYFRFFFVHLSLREQLLTATSALVYVGGAVGMEMLANSIVFAHGYDPDYRERVIYVILSHIEEVMEMMGVVIFIAVPLGRLERGVRLHIDFRKS